MAKKERMSNLELLRCIAMLMVVVLHFLGKGGLLADLAGEKLGGVGVTAWLLESFCIVAVNVYMLISGFFLCTSSFKLSRLLQLWLQVWLYSVVFGLIGALSGVAAEVSVDTHYFLTILFPVTMGHYWFMTAYVFLYLLLPLAGTAVQRMTKGQLKCTVLCLLAVFCVSKSVLPVRLETDGQGYDCIWYLCVFAAAAYVRRFGIPCLEKKGRAILLYVVSCLLIFGGTMGLRAVYLRTGSLGRMLSMCMEYNHILPFLASLGLFLSFRGITVKGKIAAVINKIAPYTLGVYLLHENIGLRYSWQKWLGAERIGSVGSLLLWTVFAVIAVFVCGIFTDMLRAALMTGAGRFLGKFSLWKKFTAGISHVDALFGEKAAQ